jgi:hypothetical protein
MEGRGGREADERDVIIERINDTCVGIINTQNRELAEFSLSSLHYSCSHHGQSWDRKLRQGI